MNISYAVYEAGENGYEQLVNVLPTRKAALLLERQCIEMHPTWSVWIDPVVLLNGEWIIVNA